MQGTFCTVAHNTIPSGRPVSGPRGANSWGGVSRGHGTFFRCQNILETKANKNRPE